MKIGNSPQEQLIQNTKDIQELKSRIVEYFTYFGDLDTSQVDCARSNTNVPYEAKKGFLIDSSANMFTINDNDGTNLLITYTCNIKGVKGDSGSVYEVIANPTQGSFSQILTTIKINGVNYTIESGGGRKYIHTLLLSGSLPTQQGTQSANKSMYIQLESDSELPFVKEDDYVEGANQIFSEWLRQNGFGNNEQIDPDPNQNALYLNAFGYSTVGQPTIFGIGYYWDSTNQGYRFFSAVPGTTTSDMTKYYRWNSTALMDIQITLKP